MLSIPEVQPEETAHNYRFQIVKGHRPTIPQHPSRAAHVDGPTTADGDRKDYGATERRTRIHHARRQNAAPLLLYRPSSPEELLRTKTTNQLHWLRLHESWFRYLPSRIGFYPAVDAAIEAFYKANAFAIVPGGGDVCLSSCLQSYSRAIRALRQTMSTPKGARSGDALLACALLAHGEGMIGIRSRESAPASHSFSHLYGVQAIMVSRSSAREESDMAREIALWHSEVWLDALAAMGQPSPFEKSPTFDQFESTVSSSSVHVVRLRALAHSIFVRMPRLIVYSKDLRTPARSPGYSTVSTVEVLTLLASECLAIEDIVVEDALLHRVHVNRSMDSRVAAVIPYSFTFNNLADFDAAIYYWQARLLIVRLCWHIGGHCSSFSKDSFSREGLRTVQNLLMSWQYGIREAAVCGMFRLFHALPALWGALNDFGNPSKVSLPILQSWLLQPANSFYEAVIGDVTPEVMDQAADVYIGGETSKDFMEPFKELTEP
ncbi:hypothetical protein LTR37_010696 [Vermiconidia calcicola]|uniref:Uncharacterized protein n=1 Tax=Vermiconidia calcicola TaxID=1690605 RepID=A0ACC3N419_9PEZI|nr:hypothetical protein LTR37_010696 [Vermiconidia calcicola]